MPKTVMLAAFEGWNDACQAATNVIRHLVSRYDSQEIRHINDEGFYDYQVARPMIFRYKAAGVSSGRRPPFTTSPFPLRRTFSRK